MDITLEVGLVSTLVGTVAAIWACWNTYQTRRSMAKADRARRVEEALQLAQEINAVARSVDELGGRLKLAYEGLFNLCGRTGGYKHGSGDSKLDRIVNEIGEKRKTVAAMQKTACHLLEDGLETLNNDQSAGHRLELKGHLVHIEEIRRGFENDLASVEGQRSETLRLDAQKSLERQISRNAANMNFG